MCNLTSVSLEGKILCHENGFWHCFFSSLLSKATIKHLSVPHCLMSVAYKDIDYQKFLFREMF